MAKAAEPLPGTSDLWEPRVRDWVRLERVARDVFSRYGYGELRTPIFERTAVFTRTIGTDTDVVQKEMYTFEDRGGRSLTLRPEGTAGVIRAIANRGLGQGEEHRVFYMGPMFRGERPAAGRRRQFHQIGVECVGSCQPLADVECIAMLVHFLKETGIRDGRVLLNTRGLAEDRPRVARSLVEHFSPSLHAMCEDCRRRLNTNVWRILDCKTECCRAIVRTAPHMLDLVGDESRRFFESVCRGLDELGVYYELAPRLVRGLDYYVHTVFEITHSGLGAQDALAGGGRYTISPPGAKSPIEGVGFAAGIERLVLALRSAGAEPADSRGTDVYITVPGTGAENTGLSLAQQIRANCPGLRVRADFSGRSMKAQMRTANKLGARYVLILGEEERARNLVLCKDMNTSEQEAVPIADILEKIRG